MNDDLFEHFFHLDCLIDHIDIRLCSRMEYGVKQLLALVTHEGDLVLHYTYGELPSVIKRIAWFAENSLEIRAICFDPSTTWLLAVSLDSSLYIVPALSLLDKKQKIDCKWSINDVTHFANQSTQGDRAPPSSVIWWQTFDCNQNALVGYESGDVELICLTDGRCLATCNVGEPIKQLLLCQDDSMDCISLLINGRSGQQWKLLLEQHSTNYIWPIETTVTTDGSTSRLQSLKQMGVDKLASLRQRLADVRGGARNDNQTGDLPQLINYGPQLLPHLCDTFFAPQHMRNRHLFSAFYKPTSLLTLHATNLESAPLYMYKLPPNIDHLLVTNQLFFAIGDNFTGLHVISSQYAECQLDGDSAFNSEALLTSFTFRKQGEKVLNIYRLTDVGIAKNDNRRNDPNTSGTQLPTTLNIRKPKIDTCVIITTRGVYSIKLSVSPLVKCTTLITDDYNVEMAEKLANIFTVNTQDLFEQCGDLLIARGAFHHGLILYKQARVHLLKRVLKLAVTGESRTLLKFIHLCLGANKIDMSTATRIHMGNLAVMAYTEIILRHGGEQRTINENDFMKFLRYEEYYDQILAVNVACQAGHWNIVNLLTKARGLQPEIVATLGQMLNTPAAPSPQNHQFLIALSEPTLTQSLLIYANFAPVLLHYIRNNVHHFPIEILQRFAAQLDPSQPSALPIVTQVTERQKTVITSSLESSLIEIIDTDALNAHASIVRDFIETFIWIVTEIRQRTMGKNLFDISLLKSIKCSRDTPDDYKISPLPKVRPLSCGFEHAAVVRNGNVYTMGVANAGCLGYGPILAQSNPPKLVATLSDLRVKVLTVSCGRKHCLANTDYGVYAWGSNAYGQLGLDACVQDCPYPQMVAQLCRAKIVDVVAGQYHSAALSVAGAVYTWGWGVHGQLGHGRCTNEYRPKLLDFKHKVIKIAAGHAHTLLLTHAGKLYGFGSNAFGQLETSNFSGSKTTVPVPVIVMPDIYTPIKLIATNHFHNIAVSHDEKVYTWGASPQEVKLFQSKCNQRGNQSMRTFEPWRSNLQIFAGKSKGAIEQVATGFRHSAILHCGKIFIGRNLNDEVGTVSLNDRDGAGVTSTRFKHVSCGLDYTMALDQSGRLLAWGNSNIAQAFLGRSQNEENNRSDNRAVLFKNTKRMVRIPQHSQTNEIISPIEVTGLPTMAITYAPLDQKSALNKQLSPYAVRDIENPPATPPASASGAKKSASPPLSAHAHCTYGARTLHYILEAYDNFYDSERVLARCLHIGDAQAASKVAMLNGHVGDSLEMQLAAFKVYVDALRVDFAGASRAPTTKGDGRSVRVGVNDDTAYLHTVSFIQMNYAQTSVSASASLDSLKQWNDDYEDEGGGKESPCDPADIGEVRQSVANYVQSFRNENLSPICSVSEMIDNGCSARSNRNVAHVDAMHEIKDQRVRNVLRMAAELIEFYIMKTHTSENYILMQNILLKCIDFWLAHNFPVPVLESILLKNMDKYFYPLSVLLFCKDFNTESEMERETSTKQEKSSGFLKQFSTKFCLQLCFMVLENVTKA